VLKINRLTKKVIICALALNGKKYTYYVLTNGLRILVKDFGDLAVQKHFLATGCLSLLHQKSKINENNRV